MERGSKEERGGHSEDSKSNQLSTQITPDPHGGEDEEEEEVELGANVHGELHGYKRFTCLEHQL